MSDAATPTAERHPVGLLPDEWGALMGSLGERAFHAKQVFRWIHERGVFSAAEMTDLSKGLRQHLVELGLGAPPLSVEKVHQSRDGTRKLLLGLHDGGRVECVLIPMSRDSEQQDADASAVVDDETAEGDEDVARERVTLCISTQFGCAMGCVFCASGQAGLQRGLKAEEIVSQVLLAKRYLEPQEDLKNLVFMGMGEPLHHYDETVRAIRLLTHPEGGHMSPRRITVSSVGLVPGIQRLGEDFDGKIGLAISLHAPDDATRGRILPMNKRYPVAQLLQSLHDYPLPRRRRITIEYTLIDGVNDSVQHAQALVRVLEGLRVKVNLIPMNPIDASELRAPTEGAVHRFRRVLTDAGLSCFVRVRRGDDVDAACGQLALADDLVKKKRRLLQPSES